MTATVERVPAVMVARLVLLKNGLLEDFTRPTTWSGFAEIISRMGYLPLGVDGFAAAHILWCRRSNYVHDCTDLMRKQRLFIGQSDGAALVPMDFYTHFRPKFWRMRGDEKLLRRLGEEREDVLNYVLGRLRRDGCLGARAIASPSKLPYGAQGRWAIGAAVQYLVETGEIFNVSFGRRGIGRLDKYDLAERVVPQSQRNAPVTDWSDWACRSAMERLVLATAREIATFWGLASREDAEAWCAEALKRGEIRLAQLDSDPPGSRSQCYILADWADLAAAAPSAQPGVRVLSPHDPAIRKAARRRAIFGLEPIDGFAADEPRRRGEVAAFPVLRGERFVARMIGLMNVAERRFEVRSIQWQESEQDRDEDEILAYSQRIARFREYELQVRG